MSDLVTEAEENHERFVREVMASGVVWGLQSERGWALCESEEYEETDVYPFWSTREQAEIHGNGEWAGYRPASLDLDLFIDTWLVGMSEDGVLVGTNWDAELSGLEVEPSDLARELLGQSDDEDED